MVRVALRARIVRPYRRLRFHSFGAHSIVHKPDWVYRPRQIAIRIGRGTWVGERVAVLRGPRIGRFCIIGANNVVRGPHPSSLD